MKKIRNHDTNSTNEKKAIRNHNASPAILSHLRKSLSLTSLNNILPWIEQRYKIHRHVASLNPIKNSQLPDRIYYSEDSFRDSIKWTVSICFSYISRLELHSKNLNRDNFFPKNHTESLELFMNEIDKSSWNLSGISSILFSISRLKGLEQQRRWLREKAYVASSSFSNVILYCKSISCEGDRHPDEIFQIIFKSILSHIDEEGTRLIIYYFTFYPSMSIEAANILAPLLLHFPVVDQYEFLIGIISSDPRCTQVDNFPYYSNIMELMLTVGDWRYAPLKHMKLKYKIDQIRLPLIDNYIDEFLCNIGAINQTPIITDRAFDIALANEFLHQPHSPGAYIARSIFELKNSQSINDVKIATFKREIARHHINKTSEEEDKLDVPLDYTILSEYIGKSKHTLESRELLRIVSILALEDNAIEFCLETLYNYSSIDQSSVNYFPSSLFADKISDDDISSIGHNPIVAISLSRISNLLGDRGPNLVYIAVEQYLWSLGLSRPSELKCTNKVEINFLREACTVTSLRQSLEFNSKEEMENERLRILFYLTSKDEDNEDSYTDEMHNIIDQQAIDELLARFHVGKVQCDESALYNWAKTEILPKFNRLNDFISAGLLPVAKNSDVEFFAHLASGRLDTFTFKIPSNESLEIARSIIYDLNHKYALDPRYGVDSYLSLGMRHGAIVAHLRSPLSTENVLIDKDSFGYPSDCFWTQYYSNLGLTNYANIIGPILARFSERYDNKLEEIKNELIQVRRSEKPKGLIISDWQDAVFLSFCARLAYINDFDELMVQFINSFWANIELNLQKARIYIEDILSNELNGLLDELEAEIRIATSQQRLSPFSDAIMRARQSLSNALDDVKLWHSVARSTDTEPLDLIDIILAAQKIVKRLYGNFNPTIQFLGDTQVSLNDSLHVMIEVFKALFINVYEHSEIAFPKIDIFVDPSQKDKLVVDFISDCADILKATQAASDINEKIKSGEYEARLSKEGGSGLAKVARATLRNGKPDTVINVDSSNCKFCVKMTFGVMGV